MYFLARDMLQPAGGLTIHNGRVYLVDTSACIYLVDPKDLLWQLNFMRAAFPFGTRMRGKMA
jgi:hypothetical protein